MPVTLITPEGLTNTDAFRYKQVAIATGSRQIYVAGQIATDANGQLVSPGDLKGQVVQAYRNVATALAAAGATFSDVVRLTVYVVDWKPEMIDDFMAGVNEVAQEIGFAPAPASLIGVSILFQPGVLVEVEATAVVD
jgi:enamine deaminase RidA (YjgF/YER057c/UK114 family)